MQKSRLIIAILSGIFIGATLMAQPKVAISQAPAEQAPAGQTPDVAAVAAPLDAPKVASDTLEIMLGALEDNNRAVFVSMADARFKAALTPDIFSKVVDQSAFRLKAGFKTTYLGEMRKAGFLVYLWRVRFDDDGDDFLVEMSLKEDKVGGFFLR